LPATPAISVCICTYQRPALLARLLHALKDQKTDASTSFDVVIADNDAAESARETVERLSASDLRLPTSDLRPPTSDLCPPTPAPFAITYCVEPERNIALVRNRAVAQATGEFIAFIDDDEFPTDDWLMQLRATCDRYQAAGVLGPVRPHFEQQPPAWIIKGRFCERPEHPTGTVMEWAKCRTGNVLFRREILQRVELPFRPEFGSGGEDQDFFMRMIERGCVFVWCNEAVAYETVPPSRWKRSFMLRRALLRGRNSLKHPKGRWALIAKSLIAVPLYLISLPVTLLRGHHWFMKVSIKLCDHLGRILTLLGVNPVVERQM
jgi:glycosyltransferase involved in cell wall biosynthesis